VIQFFSRSIARKILASFIGIYATTYLLTALFVFTSLRNSIGVSEVKTLSQLADVKMERLENAFGDLAIDLRAWAELDVMTDLVSEDVDKRIARMLEGLKRQYGLKGEVYAFDTAGKLVASSTPPNPDAAPPPLPAAWKVDGKGLVFVDKHWDTLGSNEAMALVMPVMASFTGNLRIGSLTLTYPWSALEHLLADEDALIELVRTDSDPAPLGDNGRVAGLSKPGGSFLKAWKVLATHETSAAVQAVRQVANQLLLLGLFLSIPILAAVLWLSRKLTRPVVELTGFVGLITGTDDLGKRVPVSSVDELGTLAQSFNRMAASLERAGGERERFVRELEALNQSLEAKVAARTLELKASQAERAQSDKMASLGQLVAGVAHELNNPIAFIYANFPHLEEYTGELLALIEKLRQVPADEAVRRRFDELIAEADLDFLQKDILKIIHSGKDGATRVKDIVLSLRSFSRLDEAEFKKTSLELGIDDTLALLHHRMRGRIILEKDYRLNQPVSCFPGQINQVFMNIISNAIQSIKGTGSIKIATRREGALAIVTVADSGGGIPPENLGKIFDPFFTTKKVGEGTGLGLSISYGIMEKHGGRIDVQSRLGEGTTFELRLPLEPPAAMPLSGVPAAMPLSGVPAALPLSGVTT